MFRNGKMHGQGIFIKLNGREIKGTWKNDILIDEEKKECPICKKKIHGQNMGDHMQNIHYKVKPYKCDHCGKDFFCKSNVNRHIRRVHKDKLIIGSTEMFLKMNTSIDL